MNKKRYEEKNNMIAPVYKLILTSNGSKKAWPPQKNPQNDEYVFCQLKNKNLFPQTGLFQELKYRYLYKLISMSVIQLTDSNIRKEE
jgi:hypothetical protein